MAVFSRITTAFVLACSLLSVQASLDNSQSDVAARHHHTSQHVSHAFEVMERAELTALEPREESEEGQIEERDLEARSGWGKAGLAWNDGLKSYIHPLLKTGKVSWCYTWSAWPCCEGSGCPESIPMLWGNKQISTWEKNVMHKKNHKWPHILAFNEPDQSGQSAMSVGEAVSLWWKYIEPVNSAVNVGPAVTASPNGIKWIQKFMKDCKGCHVDVVPFHFYGMNADAFISDCKNFHKMFPSKKIWVTDGLARTTVQKDSAVRPTSTTSSGRPKPSSMAPTTSASTRTSDPCLASSPVASTPRTDSSHRAVPSRPLEGSTLENDRLFSLFALDT